jgi:hypothetical protein
MENCDLGSKIFAVWWYRFENSRTVGDIDLKFGIEIVLAKLEDIVGCFLSGAVHKLRYGKKSESLESDIFMRFSLMVL